MKNISEMYKKDIVATDGRILGTLEGVAVNNDWTVSGLTMKIDKDAFEDLGAKKPFLGTLRLDVGVDHIKAMGDNIVLNKPIKDLGRFLTAYKENNNASNLLKMDIVDAKGRDVGAVQDVLLDDKHWNIPSVLVSVNKDISDILNVKKPMLSNTRVSLSTMHISGAGDKVMLSVTTERLGEILDQAPVKTM
jgi:sporulation protein YlmC with PRC-barrel domain